jgi:TRAP-type C4-dicarboxylate transport system substrate-binding protein
MPTLAGMRFVAFSRLPAFPRLIRSTAALLLTATFALSAVPAAAEDAAQVAPQAAARVTWRMTTEYPQSNISGIGLVTFSKLVAERTGGIVTAAPAFDNELKIPSAEMPRAASEGRIAGGDAFAGALSSFDAVFALPTLPFVVQSVEVARTANARARPLYEKALAAQGLRLLYLTIWPSTGLWSDRPIAGTGDIPALSMRTYDNSSNDVMRAAGANAQFLPMDAAIAGLKEHRLNAFLTSGDGGAGRKLWDYLPYFTPINYAMPISLAFVRADLFAALPPEAQSQVLAAATEAEQSQFKLLANRTSENYARMRENGVHIAETAPPSVVEALRKAATGPIAAWKARAGSEAVEIVDWAISQ